MPLFRGFFYCLNKTQTMIQDLQKRPFARPLLMWIAGVVWQTCFPVSPFLLGFWLLPMAVLLFASAVLADRKAHFSFGARWLWGAAVLPIFMFLAMQKTACSQLGMTQKRHVKCRRHSYHTRTASLDLGGSTVGDYRNTTNRRCTG